MRVTVGGFSEYRMLIEILGFLFAFGMFKEWPKLLEDEVCVVAFMCGWMFLMYFYPFLV